MEQTTKHFILKDSGLHYIPDMPEKPYINFDNDFSCETAGIEYEKKKQKAIASSIRVTNDKETKIEIERVEVVIMRIGEIYPLECDVYIKQSEGCGHENECENNCVGGCFKYRPIAFVKLKEETKEEDIHIDYLEKIIFEQVKKFDINYQAFITCEIANALKSNFIITKRQ